MNKEYITNMLKKYIEVEKFTTSEGVTTTVVLEAYQCRNANVLKAMEILASMQGWNTQRCMKQGPKRRPDNA